MAKVVRLCAGIVQLSSQTKPPIWPHPSHNGENDCPCSLIDGGIVVDDADEKKRRNDCRSDQALPVENGVEGANEGVDEDEDDEDTSRGSDVSSATAGVVVSVVLV
ncbi:hypothetical protein PFISCL1PPCAC_5359 [Pristionchus fissidentatus]|uniref:Uncharacterized protein n=1 Tax=Pristionchus fissidentatus TaxID=1538716 RepID=A0AAV5V398_9BILA|nr:hypothetical protein PFISCL1PPCAC_5359 [Pristionchus fissidentatus]